MSVRPDTVVELEWTGGLRFEARSGSTSLVLDGDGEAGVSPVQALAMSLAGCMGTDVALILQKGRLPLKSLRAHLVGERATDPPRRFLRIDLKFEVTGEVPADKVERAIALSRERYCSVWHSLRPDVEFTTSFEVQA